jgi:integrase
MASLHKQPGKPHWFCAFVTPDGKRRFKSTGTDDRNQARKICAGWMKASELASRKNLTPDRARKLIEATVSDVLESHFNGSLSRETLKKFFQTAADLVEQPEFTKERLNTLISCTVREVASLSGNAVPNATIRDWCKRWLDSKMLEAAPRTHERYDVSIRRFLKSLGSKADKDLSVLRPDDLICFRDNTAKVLSATSANMDLKVVRACLYAAIRQDLVNTNVAAKVSTIKERGEKKRRAFTLVEVKKVLTQCDELKTANPHEKSKSEWRGLVLAAVYTGQRLGDIAQLTWQQVDLPKKTISFVTQKTGKRLCLSLAKPLQDLFLALPSSENPKDFVFPNAAAMAGKHTGTISTKFYDEVLAPAGLVPVRLKAEAAPDGKGRNAKRKQSELSFHSFRHTLTTWLKSAGASNALAQMIIGHDSEIVSRGYTHLGAEDTTESIGKLPDVTK